METKRQELLRILAAAQVTASELQEDLASDHSFRAEAVEASKAFTRTLQTPADYAWELFARPIDPAVLLVAIDAGWISLINDAENADKKTQDISANELAASTTSDVQLVKRLMRVLTAAGIIRETGVGRYAPTPVSKLAVNTGWGDGFRHSLRDVMPSMAGLPAYFKENRYQQPTSGNGIYQYVHGLPLFESLQQDKEAGRQFTSFMGAMRVGETPWFDKYPVVENLGGGAAEDVLLVDIGGSKGHDLLAFAECKRKLGLVGKLVLEDLPEVLSHAPADSEELQKQAYDFFLTPQPVVGARAYFMKRVLHDWSDQECVIIMGRVRDAMKEGHSRLLIHERVVPDSGCRPRIAALDMVMMGLPGGKERTESEWKSLIDEVGGLKIEHIWTYGSDADSIIDVVKV